MKKLLVIFPILLSVLFISCSDEDNNNDDNTGGTPERAKYKTTFVIRESMPDNGTLYIYDVPYTHSPFVRYDKETHTLYSFDETIFKPVATQTVQDRKACIQLKGDKDGYDYYKVVYDYVGDYSFSSINIFDYEMSFHLYPPQNTHFQKIM